MFHGSMVALVTPMLSDEEVDYKSLKDLVEWHIAEGTNALIIAGTTGESATLDSKEKQQLIRTVVTQVHERIPVIAGTASQRTKTAIELTQMAMEEGVDACLIMTPAYIKPTQEGLFQHYKAIANAAAVPQIVYNVPGRTACDLLPETIERLAHIPNIIGVKEATGQLERAQTILAACGSQLDVYSGDDPTALELILAGAKGVISVTANVAPRLMHDMYIAAIEGKIEEAHAINSRLQALHQALFVEANPIPAKWALHNMGLIPEGIRLPLTPLVAAHQTQVQAAMQEAQINVETVV